MEDKSTQKFFHIVPQNTNYDFIGKFKYFMAFSIISGILVVAAIFLHGFNYGIDFTGGTVIQMKFNEAHSAEDTRAIIDKLGERDASVVALGSANTEYLVTVRSVAEKGQEPLNKRLQAMTGRDSMTIQRVDIVGPKVGAELKIASLRALFYTLILITVYIWLRFDFRFAPGATVAMLHDLLLSSGFYMLFGREFTITAVAALLTIAGYSVNDTIVVYDRVRELIRQGTALPLPELINKAVNLTLSRTLLTSGVTLISIVPIIIFTHGEIQSFAMAMCFGIFVGTYSTVYIASPFTIYVERYQNRKNPKNNTNYKGKPVTA